AGNALPHTRWRAAASARRASRTATMRAAEASLAQREIADHLPRAPPPLEVDLAEIDAGAHFDDFVDDPPNAERRIVGPVIVDPEHLTIAVHLSLRNRRIEDERAIRILAVVAVAPVERKREPEHRAPFRAEDVVAARLGCHQELALPWHQER